MSVRTMVETIRETLAAEMERDERVVVLGEDVGRLGGVFRATEGLQARFGEDRVIDMPLAEGAIVGAGIGLAVSGLRPVVEIQFLGFAHQAFHQIGQQVARLRYRSAGRHSVPMVIRAPFGGGVRTPELHSDAFEALYTHCPGLKVVAPSTARDARGLLNAALDTDDPVLYLEPLKGYRLQRDDVPDERFTTPLGAARIARPGRDVTIIAWSAAVQSALQAADELVKHGIDAQVLDLRSLAPLDVDGIAAAVGSTGRAVVLHEAPLTGGFGAEVAATIQDRCFYDLVAPVHRITAPDTPYPLAGIEDDYVPSVVRVVREVRAVMEVGSVSKGPTEFRMPDVGEGIAEAEVLDWFVEIGGEVQVDAPLCQVETDKSIVEIPAPVAGVLLRRHPEIGGYATVGEVLAVIGTPDQLPVISRESAPAALHDPDGPRPLASPYARRLAARRGIDLRSVTGSGPHGRILATDLDGPVAVPAVAVRVGAGVPSGDRTDEVIELRGLRRSIARSMTEALRIPHVTEFREIDATNLLAARAALKPSFEARGLRLSVFPILLKAVLRSLDLNRSMNATYDSESETLVRHGAVHLGIATATDDGLIVPVVRDATRLSLAELAAEVDRVAERARTRAATPEELTGGTFTVTNFGSFGTWLGNPVIRPPEVAIAGFGRIEPKVVAVDGEPAVRPVLPIVVATDHRINDGAHLADLVNAIADAVTQPLLLMS